MKEGIIKRFGISAYENSFANLWKLKQTGTLREYQTQFDRLLVRDGVLTDEQEVGAFISGLKESLRADV